ncbi:hypothetical protein GMO_00040 [Gluconobacter morbifer G707]|uniref:Uncharacterized protein n=1 Tax=Gluconobacter morbifer G707 TaxID=1088869 RepID=G6XET9_9PROT|nr:hypothetical protein GMO_00040 [Gluconobacter morbifer G707]
MNSRLNFRFVIPNFQFLGHDLIFVSTKPAAGQGFSEAISKDKRRSTGKNQRNFRMLLP